MLFRAKPDLIGHLRRNATGFLDQHDIHTPQRDKITPGLMPLGDGRAEDSGRQSRPPSSVGRLTPRGTHVFVAESGQPDARQPSSLGCLFWCESCGVSQLPVMSEMKVR